jgi:CHAT domain-containing protein
VPEVVRIPSATILAEFRSRAQQPAGPGESRLLAITSPPLAGERDLPGARAEVRWIQRTFRNVDLHPMSDISTYRILHFAGHTRIDDAAPWRSEIQLDRDSAGDAGRLRAGRIATMRLPADMVVLSGCESVGRAPLSGEGILGLTAAFVAAGVPTILATLWPVDDAVTNRLIRAFYRSLARGSTAAEALRVAQAEIRRAPGTRHPFYWAGFVLVGEGQTRIPLVRRFPVIPGPLEALMR